MLHKSHYVEYFPKTKVTLFARDSDIIALPKQIVKPSALSRNGQRCRTGNARDRAESKRIAHGHIDPRGGGVISNELLAKKMPPS